MSKLKLYRRPGTPNWYVRGTGNNGEQINESTRTDDEAAARSILIQTQARLLTELVHGKVATTTFDEAVAAYIEDGGQSTYLSRQLADGSFVGLAHYFGNKLMGSITQDDLDKAARELCKPGAARETLIRNVYTPFIAVWNFASSEGRRMAVQKKWDRPRVKKGTGVRPIASRSGTKPVSYERAWQFVSAMSPEPAMLMTTLFYTGMRPIEVFALQCEDVNIEGRWITVRSSKTGEGRGVPVHDVLVPLLTGLVSRGGKALFLTRHGKPYPITDEEHKGQLSGAISGARDRLERRSKKDKGKTPVILDVSPYTARHTVSTQLVMAGVHPHIKDQILGHAVDDMSRHYTNIPQAPLIEAINKLPVIPAWRDVDWMTDPKPWFGKLVRWENYGRAGAKRESVE